MPKRQLPNSNPKRAKASNALADRAAVTPAPKMPLSADTLAKLAVQQPAYNAQATAVANAKQAQTELSAQVTAAHTLGGYFVRDFVQALFNAIRRFTFENNVKAFYKIDLSSDVLPDVKSDENLNLWAKNVADGEVARIAAGGAPITFPAIADVNAATANFKALNLQQSLAKVDFDTEQEKLDALNENVDKLILKAWNEVETFYNEGDIPSMRQKAREWGVIYLNDKGMISEHYDIPPETLLTTIVFEDGELKADTVLHIINESTAAARGFLSTATGLQEGNFQEALGNLNTPWIAGGFGVDLVTHKTLNIRNLSSTEVLKITIEYLP